MSNIYKVVYVEVIYLGYIDFVNPKYYGSIFVEKGRISTHKCLLESQKQRVLYDMFAFPILLIFMQCAMQNLQIIKCILKEWKNS